MRFFNILCTDLEQQRLGKPGNIKEHCVTIRSHRALQGEFIWDWPDQGILAKAKNDNPYFAYGSDFNS